MGAVISQDGRPVAYWSKKLTDTQQKYPTTDQEILAIVECLKQYKMMLFGQTITVWTPIETLLTRILNMQVREFYGRDSY